MRCKKRKFYTGEPQHIYQRTIDGFNIFYDIEDFLVFYTVFSISAKKTQCDSAADVSDAGSCTLFH